MRTVLLLLALAAHAVAEDGDLGKRIDPFCKPLIESGRVVGMSIAVRSNGKESFRGYGRFAKGSDRVPDADSIFEIGSISKVFTGVLLASMVQREELGLDDRITKHLPDRAPDKITLRHLATHRAGLPRMPGNWKPADVAQPFSGYDAKALYACLKGLNVPAAPKPYLYSNLGAGLLGHIVERKAGKSYEELLQERITGPLKMTSTAIVLSDEQSKRFVPGHGAGGRPVKSWPWKDSALVGAGAIRSTTRDLMRFAKAQSGDDPALALARKTHTQDAPKMGLGWHYGQFDALWHNGQTGGYKSYLAVDPADGTVVIVLANTTAAEIDQLAVKLFLLLKGRDVKPDTYKAALKVPADVLARYEGTYVMTPMFQATVKVEEGRLMVQWTGQPSLEVFADSKTKFSYRAVAAQIEFEVGDDGKATGLTLFQNGREMKAKKK